MAHQVFEDQAVDVCVRQIRGVGMAQSMDVDVRNATVAFTRSLVGLRWQRCLAHTADLTCQPHPGC